MQPILLGVDGLGYGGGFMECETATLLSLVNSMERGGVVENHAPQSEQSAWSSVLMMDGPDPPASSALIKATKQCQLIYPSLIQPLG